MSDRRNWFKRVFKLDYDEKFDGALELIRLQEYELDRTATLAGRVDSRVDGLQEAVKITVKRVDDIESQIQAIQDFDFGGRRMLAQFDIEAALAGDTAIRVQLDNVNHEARLRFGSVNVVDTIDAVWFISKTGVSIDNDFGEVLHPNAQRRDVIEFLKGTSDSQGNMPLPGDPSGDIQDLDDKLNQEIKDRIQGDEDLTDALAQEITDRADGDQVLQDQIDALPAATPPYDDTALAGKIDQEITDREDADTALDAKIAKEVTDRDSGDKALDAKVTKEAADRAAGDKALDDKIDAHLSNHPSGGNFMPISGGEFDGPILGPVIDPVSTEALSISILSSWNDSIPAEGELVISSAFPDSSDPVLKFNLGENINHLATRTDLFYVLVTPNGQQIWKCSTGGTALNATTLKVVPDEVEGEVLSTSGNVLLFVTGSDGYPYTTTVTVDRMIQAYLANLPGGADMSDYVKKAGDFMTGNLAMHPNNDDPNGKNLYRGLVAYPPKNADGTNDTSKGFGIKMDIDILNSWKTRFVVNNRYGDILQVRGGGGPMILAGPIEDPDDSSKVKGVPLVLSAEPTEDDHAVTKEYVDLLGDRLTEDVNFEWEGFGNYQFKRSADSAGSGIIQCIVPSGAPHASAVEKVWIHKTNKDGNTHDPFDTFKAGNVLKLNKNMNPSYYRILDSREGNANNTEVDVAWFRGDDPVLYVNDIINIEEGTTRASDFAHLNSSNEFAQTNLFNGAIFQRPNSGSGYKDFIVKGHVDGASDANGELLSVYRNRVSDDEADAVNYYGKMEGDQNLINVQGVRDLIASELVDAIQNLEVDPPRFYTFTDRITATCIGDPSRFPILMPTNFFIPKSQETNTSWNQWPGNCSWIDLHIGDDDLFDQNLATGAGSFTIRTIGGDIVIAGMFSGYAGTHTLFGQKYERFHVAKWAASGEQWKSHDAYYLALGGSHWEKRA